jgi:hypothetical protein
MKKTIAILLAVMFLLTVTVVAVSAGGCGGGYDKKIVSMKSTPVVESKTTKGGSSVTVPTVGKWNTERK